MASFLSDLFGGGAEKDAADRDRAIAAQYQAQALPALQTGYNTGVTNLNQGIQAYQPLANLGQTYAQGASPYMAALGVGSPDAIAQATQNFQNTPGFQAQLQNAQQAVQRQRAIGGMGASGNADIDQILGQAGLTGNAYQQYVQNLLQSQGLAANTTAAAARGQAAGYGGLADLAQNYAQNQTGIYGNVAQTDIGASNLQGQGEAAGAKNLLNAGMSLATLAMGGNPFGGSLTGGSGGGGFGNSLMGRAFTGIGNAFMGGGSPSGYGNPWSSVG